MKTQINKNTNEKNETDFSYLLLVGSLLLGFIMVVGYLVYSLF